MRITLFIAAALAQGIGFAQKQPEVLLHVQSGDTLVYRSLVNQIVNLKKEIPGAAIEVVCHGPGMDFLLAARSGYINKIHNARLGNVSFVGCEFTMKQRKIRPEDLVPYALVVPFGLVEIVKKQQAGWLYIKTGF
jgi:intracellular sulfur oxidation DsrE/DsrF family protein